jgi:anion-transporting  ArsA/GET3 family ATPase
VSLLSGGHPLLIVVGSGGVGKTTLAASLGVAAAEAGKRTLVMTFDPSLRLKDALGVDAQAREAPVAVELPPDTAGVLEASLLDAKHTFDRLVTRYAPDPESRDRILGNRFYNHLAGNLAGILEYMAVERLFEVAEDGGYDQVILDTPPTRQALDFLEAPERIVAFLDSGALRIALKPWFDEEGNLKAGSRFGFVGKRFERFLDEIVGLDLLRDMATFFRAFAPLFDGFRERAVRVQQLLRSPETRFLLVSGPGEERIPDTLFFARKLEETGHHLGPVVVNRYHPLLPALPSHHPGAPAGAGPDGHRLFAWLAERDRRGLEVLEGLLTDRHPLAALPLQAEEPTDLASLRRLGAELLQRLDGTRQEE